VALDPNKLVRGMFELLRRSLREDIRIELALSEGVWPIHADQNQLENAILNLALNARDAMPEGGTLAISTSNEAAPDGDGGLGERVILTVGDTGAGMTPDVLARAFDPFFTTKPHGAGTGLGLSQVYGFLRQSGGDVKIHSAPGQGTVVKMMLPRFKGVALAAPERAARGVHGTSGHETILLVEDDPAVRAVNADALRELGYAVISAASPAEALRALDAQADIALLFTDVVMPEINGRRLAEECRRRRPGLRVLFTTGYMHDAAVQHGVLERDVEVLTKPFTVEELGERLRKILHEPRMAQSA
jgi:CheY-like chemotaxis protein